ncbi:MAG: KEOPS complex subunit Pcc1 [Candidatus Heimdallarchaeota archaeon]
MTISTENPKAILAAYHAIQPETMVMITQRGKAAVEMTDDQTLIMKFHATDFISLRAMLGSYIRWLDVAFSSINQ